jgi:stearoyl-CoA desaturase (delta-9 desaturase)
VAHLLQIWNNLGGNFKKVYVPQHIIFILGIASIFTGAASAWWLLLVYPAWFLFGHIGFGIFIHKYYCHESFETYPWIAKLGAYFGMLSGTGSPLMLRVLHQGYHHKYSDTDKDPHSPEQGFWWSYFLWLNHKWNFKKMWLVKDMIKDPVLKFFHKQYYKIYWGTFLLLCLIDWRLAVFSISAATVIEFHLSGLINTWGHIPHKGSYQNYPDCGDTSQNVPWFNWFTLGLGLHNNHHARPWEYNYAHKPGEIDFAKWFIPLIEKKNAIKSN